MIIRVFEGRLKAGSEQEFMDGERKLLRRTDVDGLLGVSIGRRLAGGQMNVITLSVWQDRASIERFAQRDVDRPVFLTGSEDLVESWSLDHYEAVDSPDTAGDDVGPTAPDGDPDAYGVPNADGSAVPTPEPGPT